MWVNAISWACEGYPPKGGTCVGILSHYTTWQSCNLKNTRSLKLKAYWLYTHGFYYQIHRMNVSIVHKNSAMNLYGAKNRTSIEEKRLIKVCKKEALVQLSWSSTSKNIYSALKLTWIWKFMNTDHKWKNMVIGMGLNWQILIRNTIRSGTKFLMHTSMIIFIGCLLKAYNPANHTGSPQGFHKFKSYKLA